MFEHLSYITGTLMFKLWRDWKSNSQQSFFIKEDTNDELFIYIRMK